MEMTQNQKAARSALVMGLMMNKVAVTNAEVLTMLDDLFSEWPEELKTKAGPLAELVRVEDERAAGGLS